MMEMDDRDSAKCQKSKRRDTNGIIEFVNESKDKMLNSGCLLKQKEAKTCRGRQEM